MSNGLKKSDFEWRHDPENGDLCVFLLGGKLKYGRIVGWHDKKTMQPGFTGIMYLPDGKEVEFMPSEGFATPLALAQEELLQEILAMRGRDVESGVESQPRPTSTVEQDGPTISHETMKVIRSIMDFTGMKRSQRIETLRALLAEIEGVAAV